MGQFVVEKLIWQETFDTRHVYYDPFRLPRSQRMGFAVLHIPDSCLRANGPPFSHAHCFDLPVNLATFDEHAICCRTRVSNRGTYRLHPIHPPLSRIAIGLPLYLAGKRFPMFPTEDVAPQDYNVVGNAILYGDDHYARNLTLARVGILPFFVGLVILVFIWTRNLYGSVAAIFAVFFLTTMPSVLGFAGIAYTISRHHVRNLRLRSAVELAA